MTIFIAMNNSVTLKRMSQQNVADVYNFDEISNPEPEVSYLILFFYVVLQCSRAMVNFSTSKYKKRNFYRE